MDGTVETRWRFGALARVARLPQPLREGFSAASFLPLPSDCCCPWPLAWARQVTMGCARLAQSCEGLCWSREYPCASERGNLKAKQKYQDR